MGFAKQAVCPVLSDEVSGSHLKTSAANEILVTIDGRLSCNLKLEVILIHHKGNVY